jgi:hypothetical protein
MMTWNFGPLMFGQVSNTIGFLALGRISWAFLEFLPPEVPA